MGLHDYLLVEGRRYNNRRLLNLTHNHKPRYTGIHMSDSTALTHSTDSDYQYLWNERNRTYEVLDLKTGRLVSNYQRITKETMSTSVSYTPIMGDIICDAIRRGLKLKDIENDPQFPPINAIQLWKATNPEFRRRLETAYRDRAERYHDEAVDTAMSAISAPKEMQAGLKLAVSTLQWAAEKGNPDRYGARKEQSSGNSGGVTVIIDTGVKSKGETIINIDVDHNGEFKGFINETHTTVRGTESTGPERSSDTGEDSGTIEGSVIEIPRDRWRELETEQGSETQET